MLTLRQAKPEELEMCLEILRSGKDFQRQQGFIQWADNFPDPKVIAEDVEKGNGFLLLKGGIPVSYQYISLDGDPSYPGLEGTWQKEGCYGVIHRIAFAPAFRGRGLSGQAFETIGAYCKERGAKSLRLDTHPDNKRMQHVLEKNGFSYRGIVMLPVGLRWAYDKIL
jgi:RimJ/RimL family protein N-acetyltransferase